MSTCINNIMPTFFKGFNTVGNDFGNYVLTDFELVKRDLLNHFSIRKGEKLENPEFGTIIWDMIFDPLDATSRQAISDDVEKIARSDPRIEILSVTVSDFEHGIQLEMDLRLVPLNQVEKLELTFDTRTKAVTS